MITYKLKFNKYQKSYESLKTHGLEQNVCAQPYERT